MAWLRGKTAIVTDASSGIGASTACALAREGVRVAGVYEGVAPVTPDETPETLVQSSGARTVRAHE